MKYLIILSYWFFANLIVRIVNSSAWKLDSSSFLWIMKLLLILAIPILFYNLLFILFFNTGSKEFPFIALEMMSLFFALVLGVAFQIFVFKQALSTEEIIGVLVMIIWVFIMNKTKIMTLLG